MALKTFVKVGNVSNLSDARYCAGMEVNILGFPFDGPDAISAGTFNEITGWLSGVEFAAEFRNSTHGQIMETLENCSVNYIQVATETDVAFLSARSKVILEIGIRDISSVSKNLDLAYLVVTGELPGDLDADLKNQLTTLCECYKVLLGVSLKPENINSLLEELPVYGIAMNGSEEIRPGYKDYDQLADILELLETDN